MEKSMNIVIVETQQQIIEVLKNSGLPAAVTELIMDSLATEVRKQSSDIVTREYQAYQDNRMELMKQQSQAPDHRNIYTEPTAEEMG